MNHYSFYNMSKIAQKAAGVTFESISHLAEGFLFFYLGISIFESNVNFIFRLLLVWHLLDMKYLLLFLQGF